MAPARAAVAAAKDSAFLAGRRFGTINLRVTRALRNVDAVGPAVLRLLDEARQVRAQADGRRSLLKQLLANIEWRCECLRDDLVQLDRLINPPPIEGGPRLEVVKRPPPPGPEAVVFPAGHPTAGEAA